MEIPERRRYSSGFLLFSGACARDGLAHPAGLALSVSHRLDCSSARRINRQPGSFPAPFGPSGPLASRFSLADDVVSTLFAQRGQPDSFDQRIHLSPSPGHKCTVPWGLPRRSTAARCCGTREELASGLRDVLFMQQISGKRTRGINTRPFSLCDCLCSGILPLERAQSARTKLLQLLRGCQREQVPEAAALCEADRQRRQRPASQRMQPLRSESSA